MTTSLNDRVGRAIMHAVYGDPEDLSRASKATSVVLTEMREEFRREREVLAERLQLMAAAERESAKESTARAVAYETAAEMVAGGSPL